MLPVACSILLSLGHHYLECEAHYLHTTEQNQRYWDVEEMGFIAFGPIIATCSGEGHPEQLILLDLGQVQCSWSAPLFQDGFESGDVSRWK